MAVIIAAPTDSLRMGFFFGMPVIFTSLIFMGVIFGAVFSIRLVTGNGVRIVGDAADAGLAA